jgi:NhaP-type Na+/H+ or K+/H+ antiporter
MDEQQILLAFTAIGTASLACQWLAWRLRLPAILFLLISGILAGPVLGWLDPQALFGPLLFDQHVHDADRELRHAWSRAPNVAIKAP